MCETAGIGVAPHNPLGPIASAAALHFAISTPNFVIQEEMSGAVPWFDTVVQGPIQRDGDAWTVPEASGLGVEVDEAETARHPFAPEVLHAVHAVLLDGTVVDW
jgi:galactonate dehydratase